MSEQELPPWLREQLARFNQLQQNLQAILMQKQQLEIETAEIDKALEELKKVSEGAVYKAAGPILLKADRNEVIKELEEKKELANTRSTVLTKQENRLKESLKEVQSKLDEMLKGISGGSARAE